MLLFLVDIQSEKYIMLTPRFTLDQDETCITITIYAPFTNIADTEIFMDDTDFRFFSKPYFLRLHLPNAIEETDSANAKYDPDMNSFVIKAPKKTSGEFFPGLDMISELLKPKGTTSAHVPIEILEECGDAHDEDIDCYFEQQIQETATEPADIAETSKTSYGFAFSRGNVFNKLLDECEEILDIKNLDEKSFAERTIERKQKEEEVFSPDHYLADMFEPNEDLNNILNLASNWREDIEFSKVDTERMITLGTQRKTPAKAGKENALSISIGLLDILYAYCYDLRTTEWEQNPESAWTISKMCATLCCGEKYLSINECVITTIRRSLCYPLYRSWKLSLLVWKDVCDLLKYSGKKAIVKVLLDIISLFANREGFYLYNQLYIEDYALWCQSLSHKWVTKCLEYIDPVLNNIKKQDLNLNLDNLELLASEIISKQITEPKLEREIDLLEKIAGLNINEEIVDSDDSDSEENTSESSDCDSSDDSNNVDSDCSDSDESSENSSGVVNGMAEEKV
jgi:protein SHQ1